MSGQTTNGDKKAPPTREQLVEALKLRRAQVTSLARELNQVSNQQRHVVAHPVRFPRYQLVRLDQPVSTGICFGIGLILAPLALAIIVCGGIAIALLIGGTAVSM